jgi:hypothetical protein
MINKSNTEKVIVVRPGVAVPTAGDRLYNPTTTVFNQAVGSIGAYVDVAGSGNPAAVNPATYAGEQIRFIQVRDTSGDRLPLPPRYLETSQYIHGNCAFGLELAGQAYESSSDNAWTLGAPNAATTGKITIDSFKDYVLQASARGYRSDMYSGIHTSITSEGRFTSPDWSAGTITTEVNRRDYTVKAIVADFNQKNSGKRTNQVALAIAIDTAGTTSTGPTLASIIAGGAGVNVVIGYQNDCKPVNMRVTEGRLQAITDLEARLVADFGIVAGVAKIAPYALPQNQCGAGIDGAGNGDATADMIFTIAIDENQAYYDEIPNTKKRIDVGFNEGSLVGTVSKTLISSAKELKGSARSLQIEFENEENYRAYTSSKPWGANHVAYPNEILSGEVYDIYTLEFCHNRSASNGSPSYSPHRLNIALVHTERPVAASTFSTGAVNPQKTYVEAVLNAIGSHYNLETVNL